VVGRGAGSAERTAVPASGADRVGAGTSPLRRRVPTLVAWAVRIVAISSLAELFGGPEDGRQGPLVDVLGDAATVVVLVTSAAVRGGSSWGSPWWPSCSTRMPGRGRRRR
jgi:hypothetical protein